MDFERWSLLNLSIAARINTVKMITLPKFLYPFQCVPIFLPQTFFSNLDGCICDFIWNKKPPRMSKQLLQRPKSLGGMALPNLRYYYWAANLKILQFWLHPNLGASIPIWLSMEANTCRPVSLSALVHSPIKSATDLYTKNIIVKTSLKIWKQFRRFFWASVIFVAGPNNIKPCLFPISSRWRFHRLVQLRHQII